MSKKNKKTLSTEVVNEDKLKVEGANLKNSKWYDSEPLKNLGAITIIMGLCICFYENYRIPTLNNEINSLSKKYNDKVKELENRNKIIEELKSSPELIKLQGIVREQSKLLKAKDEQIEAHKNQIKEISDSRMQCNNKANELNIANQKWKKWEEENNNKLMECQNNLDIKDEINKLRKKIEYNNASINRSDYYKPNDEQIKTWRLDNQSLNEMIAEYQRKLACQK